MTSSLFVSEARGNKIEELVAQNLAFSFYAQEAFKELNAMSRAAAVLSSAQQNFLRSKLFPVKCSNTPLVQFGRLYNAEPLLFPKGSTPSDAVKFKIIYLYCRSLRVQSEALTSKPINNQSQDRKNNEWKGEKREKFSTQNINAELILYPQRRWDDLGWTRRWSCGEKPDGRNKLMLKRQVSVP